MSRSKPVVQLQSKSLSRRDALRWMGSVVAAAPFGMVLGCDSDVLLLDPETAGSAAAGGGGGEALVAAGSSASAGSGGAQATAGASSRASDWAVGGTAGLVALASYPDPFSTDTATSCALTCQATVGPCHDDQAPEREDISESKAGLPMRFGLRIIDDSCQPVTDADVDIWHCDAVGIYSSETSDNPAFCTGDHPEALAARYFRGHRMTDENGVAWFSTCFPGWYPSRAIHVHFTVRRSSRSGTEYLTSQFTFATDLIDDICSNHPDYAAHGLPSTPTTSDTVFPADSLDDYLMQTQRMSDGALLAWKTVIIRSSLTDSVCGDTMMGGPGGMGMPPGGTPGTGMPPGAGMAPGMAGSGGAA
jgi:protocatechuate 3,4-dioxygenase beta subunit